MNLREAAQQALEALEANRANWKEKTDAITALRTALAEPEQEPVAWSVQYPGDADLHRVTPALVFDTKEELEKHFAGNTIGKRMVPLYTHPPQRKPMTDEELKFIADQYGSVFGGWEIGFARAIERAHGIGGEE